jgi:hypothetical protein
MKVIKSLTYVLCLLLFITSCKDKVDSELQAAQDLVKGEWEITEVSDALWNGLVENPRKKFAAKGVSLIERKKISGSTLLFNSCDSRVLSTNGICGGDFTIAGVSGAIMYANRIDEGVFEMSTVMRTVPGDTNFTPFETEVMNAFSGLYKITKINNQIKLTVLNNGYSEFTDDSAFMLLTKK